MRKLGFAGASMTDGLLKALSAAFKPDLFVNHYGSSEIYTFTIDQNAPAKPGSAGRAGINQLIRVVKLGAASPGRHRGGRTRKARSSRTCSSDEAFEGYWRRPDANAKALREGWYFTGDTGYFDADGDLFVTGRVDDMIITGGENVSPVEIESCLSLHPAVSEVAVVGLADERWGKIVAAFVKRGAAVAPDELDQHLPHVRPRQLQAAAPLRVRRRPSRNRRSASCCAASWSRANTNPNKEPPHECRPSPIRASRRSTASASRSMPARERADVILDRPPFNIVSMPQRDQLRLVFEALDEDARVRVIVRARGRRAFLLRRQHQGLHGGDAGDGLEARLEHRGAGALFEAGDRREPRLCFGVGFELSLACDFRIVSETCFYALPEQRLGQIPGSGGSARLQKIIGITRTKDIVMRSKRIPGKQAYDWGIATECVPDAELEKATDALVDELRTFSPLAQRTAKKLLNDTEDSTLSIAIELEGHCYSRLRQSDDFKEGVEAFHAKRPAKFKGS